MSIEETSIKPNFRGLYRSLITDIGIPLVLVQILIRHNVSLLHALVISAVFPLASAVYGAVRNRRVDFIAAIALFFIIVGVLSSLASGDVRFALVKESFGTGLFGLICLGSLFSRRPLMFVLGREFATGKDPVKQAEWDTRWDASAYFRSVNRIITSVWGIGYLMEAVLRVVFAYTLESKLVALISPLLAIVTTLLLIAFTIAYSRYARRHAPTQVSS